VSYHKFITLINISIFSFSLIGHTPPLEILNTFKKIIFNLGNPELRRNKTRPYICFTAGDESVKILKLAGTLTTEDDLEQTVSKIINGSRKNVPNFAELKVDFPDSGLISCQCSGSGVRYSLFIGLRILTTKTQRNFIISSIFYLNSMIVYRYGI
jgi:hypothetical protein